MKDQKEHSGFLECVLHAVQSMPHGVSVDVDGEPNPVDVARIANLVDEDFDDVVVALKGLRAGEVLMEREVDFPGIEPLCWWLVHPQCRLD